MSHLNCFKAYSADNENQLTRAFLILLRLIPLVQMIFIEGVRDQLIQKKAENIIPALTDPGTAIEEVQTQTGHILPGYGILISVIISDEGFNQEHTTIISDRAAIYDGVIYYKPGWVIIVENKPRSYNIWEEQLNPGKAIGEQIIIEPKYIDLKWRDIIAKLVALTTKNMLNGTEKALVEDFLSFIWDRFIYLNPYTKLGLCKDNLELLNRRCVTILKTLSKDIAENRWGSYIPVSGGPVKQIMLYPKKDENAAQDAWYLELAIYPGDTMNQAREFYSRIDTQQLKNMISIPDWDIKPNMHFSFIATHLCWANTNLSVKDYAEYWKKNSSGIAQYSRENGTFRNLFNKLLNDNLISQSDLQCLEDNFEKTKRENINICPGIGFRYQWTKEEACRLDSENELEAEITKRINAVFSVFGASFS